MIKQLFPFLILNRLLKAFCVVFKPVPVDEQNIEEVIEEEKNDLKKFEPWGSVTNKVSLLFYWCTYTFEFMIARNKIMKD